MSARPVPLAVALLLLLALLTAPGCEDAKQQCAQAQQQAEAAWQAYVTALESAHAEAKKTQRNTAAALALDMEKRVSDIAKVKADQRYDRGSGAWQRAYQYAYDQACREDEECRAVKFDNAQSRKDASELEEKLQAARRARDAARETAAKARLAADMVPDDYANRELVKAARQASEGASLACRKVKP